MSRLAAVDRWTLAYAALSTLALALHWPVRAPWAPLLLVAQACLALTAFLAPHARRSGPVGRFLGDLYPIALVSFLYTEIGLLNLSAGRSFDALIQSWEASLFGMQPSREWIRACPWPWLSTLMHLGYLSYYVIVAVPPLALWFAGRRRSAQSLVLVIAATFYVCYAIFLAFPVAGPRYTFPLVANAATGIPLAVMTQGFLNSGAAWGTAFPSSHVAVALATSLKAGRDSRVLGWIFVPLAVLLTLGTVYGQFHYAVDALGGMLVAASVLICVRDRRPPGSRHPLPAEPG